LTSPFRSDVSTRGRILTGSFLALIIILGGLAIFIRAEIRRSFPVTEGSLQVHGLYSPVTVVRDSFGVPHITAANQHDLFLAIGFVHAQDRLWQMDLERRTAAGRLSEIFGSSTLPFDRMFRIVGLERAAEEEERALSPQVRDRLQWYADGVNAFLVQYRDRYPLEFDVLRYDPTPWEPVHSLLVGKLMAWELNLSWWTDLTYGAIAARVGADKTSEIFPGYPADVPPEVPASVWKTYAELRNTYLSVAHAYAMVSGTAAFRGGSNAWAVAARRSQTGSALLANDTHLRLELPPRWYELSVSAPGFTVEGMTIAGVPAVIAGRNASIAWGVTNVMADDADFYVERIDSLDPSRYLDSGQWRTFTILHEEIPVRGEDPSPLTIRLTDHGPIVTDIRTSLQLGHAPYIASMRWTGTETQHQLDAFLAIDTASSWDEFTEGLKLFPGPAQNFVYADVRGNIGYWCAGKIPVRSQRNSLLPVPGWLPDVEWRGFIPFRQLPHLYNPPSGFIASANNKLVDDAYPYHLSDLWEPPARIERLRDFLSVDSAKFSVDDFQRFQSDAVSYSAREVLPYILHAMADSALHVRDEERLLEYLRNWNDQFATDDIATTIYQEFFVRLLHNTYSDEMGEALFHDWVMLTNIPIRVTTALLEKDTSGWFDDVRTPRVETRDEIIRKSMREACAILEEKFGPEMKRWRWGELHTVTLRHPFGLKKPFDKIFNVGPFPDPGASTALVSGEYDFNNPFTVTVGPSFRQIFSLGTGEIRAILPGGQSGQLYERHYADQVQMWLHGVNRVEWWNRLPETKETLSLEP
jgi:penicillin amidase